MSPANRYLLRVTGFHAVPSRLCSTVPLTCISSETGGSAARAPVGTWEISSPTAKIKAAKSLLFILASLADLQEFSTEGAPP
ncbi:hypothetical protein amb2234 [Paramagnetospirillum magneticum AMB-1]|uniref:Uncharacterized protein n=1 Tax=Paramagnetospirillum magneticum (strain ATCC 700264 / AMB-1) TaxID=342108 RepID=Q2W538_PARM1|nr:hypothetical protein amb2234 [Paramagnetospirillum magneticum AMB-1]